MLQSVDPVAPQQLQRPSDIMGLGQNRRPRLIPQEIQDKGYTAYFGGAPS